MKLNPGAPVEADAPPKLGAPLLFAPKDGAGVLLLEPPNWKGPGPPEGAVDAPKLNMFPDAAAGAEPAFPASGPWVPEVKGLVNEEEAEFPPNWNPNDSLADEFPPKDEPALLAAGVDVATPKRGVEETGAAEPAPNEGAAEVVEAPPKLKMGAAEAPALPLPLPNALLAGDGASCFMGLPSSPVIPDEVGDLGAPKRGFEAPLTLSALLEAAPKLKIGAAAGLSPASALGAVASPELGAPNIGLAVDPEALPNKLLVVLTGLAPNREVVADVLLAAPKSEVLGASVAGVSLPAGLAPNRVDDCITGPLDSAGLLTAPNRLPVGAGVLGLSSDLAPNKLVVGFAGSEILGASAAGLGAKSDPKLG